MGEITGRSRELLVPSFAPRQRCNAKACRQMRRSHLGLSGRDATLKPVRWGASAIAALFLGLLVPFVVHACLTWLLVATAPRWPWLVDLVTLLSVLLSVGAGFAFLVRPFRRYVVIIAIIYFPTMMWAVSRFGPSLSQRLFGSSR
jgi:hypothetical protein